MEAVRAVYRAVNVGDAYDPPGPINALRARHPEQRVARRRDLDARVAVLGRGNRDRLLEDSLGYGRLCEALPVFPCGAAVLAPIGRLTVIR